MGFETLKRIGEMQKNKGAKLTVSVSKMTDGEKVVNFVSVQEQVYNEEKDQYRFSGKGYTINVNKWAEFMGLMNGVSGYLKTSSLFTQNVQPAQQQETSQEPESSGPRMPSFMSESKEE